MSREEVLRELAEEILDDKGRAGIEDLIEEGRLDLVAVAILSALDTIVRLGRIKDVRAKEIYTILAVDPAEVARLRALRDGGGVA